MTPFRPSSPVPLGHSTQNPRQSPRQVRRTTAAIFATALLAASAHAQTSWVPTATKAIPLQKATSLGTLSGSTPLRLVIALKMGNEPGLKELVREQHTPGNRYFQTAITPSEFLYTYAPSSSQVQEVESYLGSKGFTSIQHESNNLFVTANATAAQASAAFHTHLGAFHQFGRTVYANTTPAEVPSTLGNTVLAVLGLTNAGVFKAPTHVVPPTLPPSLNGLNAKQFQIAYDAANAAGTQVISTGSKTSVAIFAEGDLTQVFKDLRQYESVNHLPQVPYSLVRVGIPSPDTSGQDEWDLDSQTSTGIAQTVKHLYFYDTTSLSDSDVGLMFNRFAAQDYAQIGNASFGLCEVFAYLDGSMLADDEVFLQAAAQGQTVFASTGDNGSACPVAPTNGVPLSGAVGSVLYPASSPYVVAVGGTTLLTNADNTYLGEAAWYGGGGGASAFETAPYWQSGVSPLSPVGKSLPDISMDADPNTGAIVYVSGAPLQVGGTSLASPLAAGSWARVQSSNLDDPSAPNEFGFASPDLYFVYQAYPTTPATEPIMTGPPPTGVIGPFHDILTGTNGGFQSLPRYDYTTGLGTLDIKKLAVDIELHEPSGKP